MDFEQQAKIKQPSKAFASDAEYQKYSASLLELSLCEMLEVADLVKIGCKANS